MSDFITYAWLIALLVVPAWVVLVHSWRRWPHIRLRDRLTAIVWFDGRKMREWDQDRRMLHGDDESGGRS